MFDIQEELKKLPGKPGVYLMHDEKDEIIYVGKAISLKNRVRQYFQTSRNKGPKIEQMVTKIARFEYIITDSELEALVLECNLIKEYRPKYNTMLMDDKTYPYIKVTTGEAYPRILFSRLMKKDKAKYFGPYTSAAAVKDTIELLRKIYKIRTCHRNLPKDIGIGRPCLYHHIGQCDAPCQGSISQEDYLAAQSKTFIEKLCGGNLSVLANALCDSGFCDFVEGDALGLGGIKVESRGEMPGNGFSFAVRVRREIDFVCGLGFLFQLFDERSLAADVDVFCFEVIVDVDAEGALWQIADVTDGCHNFIARAQIAFDSIGFGGRFEDN